MDKTGRYTGLVPDYTPREREPISESAPVLGSIAESSGRTEFNYVNIVGKGCDGWLNLFFGDYCVAMINDTDLADTLRNEIKERQ